MALLDVDEATERFRKKLDEGYFDDKGLSDEEIQTMMKALVDADKESEDDYEPPDDEYDDGYKDGYKAMQDKINAAIAEIENKALDSTKYVACGLYGAIDIINKHISRKE